MLNEKPLVSETITLESLQALYTRWLDAKQRRQAQVPQDGLKGLMKYKQALDESVKLELELESSISAFFSINPGVDLDSLFTTKES